MQAFADSRQTKLPLILNENVKVGNSLVPTGEPSLRPLDWAEAFGDVMAAGGFDVIIGNPPYVKEYVNRRPFEELRSSSLTKYYEGKMDIWQAFACHAIDLLKPGGVHSFIATNNWITSAGAKIFRRKILAETQVRQFVDFGPYQVFPDVGIQTMIYVVQKAVVPGLTQVLYMRITRPDVPASDVEDVLQEPTTCDFAVQFDAAIQGRDDGGPFTFVDRASGVLLKRIEAAGNYYLKATDMTTGVDVHQDFVVAKHLGSLLKARVGEGIFVLSTEEKESLGAEDAEQVFLKPYYTTEQLGHYYGQPANNLWLIYTDTRTIKRMNEYPHIRAHLDKFASVITSDNKPYGLHRARKPEFFLGEKVISLRKTDTPRFTYTDFPCFVSQTFVVLKPSDINLKYLTGILNSRLSHYWFDKRGKKQGNALQIDAAPLVQFPIHQADLTNAGEATLHHRLVALVEEMLALQARLAPLRSMPTSERDDLLRAIERKDREIDGAVYDLYGLAEAERKLVEKEMARPS